MREEPMDPNEYLMQELLINRLACEAAIQQHRYLKAQHDHDFQRFIAKVLRG